MSKSVQIPYELFLDLVKYFTEPDDDLAEHIQDQLEKKLDSIIARQYFTKYKTAPEGPERELFRQKYLDEIGMTRDFRSQSECHETYST